MNPSLSETDRLINNPHDAYFKHLLGRRALAIEFLRLYLPPEVTAELNLRTLERIGTTFVREDLREYFSDLIFSVERRHGGTACVYILLDHKSAPDKWVAFQLLGYEIRIWESLKLAGWERLPMIIPVVVYHGRRKWNISRWFGSLVYIGTLNWLEYLPDFKYHLCDSPDLVRQAVDIVNQHEPTDRRTLTEASGGINLTNVRQYAEAGVDMISIGALTHSAPAVDISFKIKPA